MKEDKIEVRGSVDVVVPVYRPDEKLKQQVEMLNHQTLLPEKIIFMVTLGREENRRDEETNLRSMIGDQKIPMEFHFIRKKEFDHGGTRNRGIGYSKHDYVLCMTQDAVPEDHHMVEELLRPFTQRIYGAENGFYEGHEILISYGRQMPAKDCRPVEAYTRSFNYPLEGRIKTKEDLPKLGIKTFFASNVCAMYKREAFLARGGFPEHTIFNEDMIFAGRSVNAGFAIAYAAGARVIHSHNLSGGEQFHRNFDLAVSQVDFPEVFEGIRSESEGIRLVKKTMGYLVKNGMILKIPGMIYSSGCKYLGYLLGKRYKKLPKRLVVACSMNKQYWRNL